MSKLEFVVYRFFDKNQKLLYVGISKQWPSRWVSHERASEWFTEATSATIERFATQDEMMAAEAKAIQTENPIHNKFLNPGYESAMQHLRNVHKSVMSKKPDDLHKSLSFGYWHTYGDTDKRRRYRFFMHIFYLWQDSGRMECDTCAVIASKKYYYSFYEEIANVRKWM